MQNRFLFRSRLGRGETGALPDYKDDDGVIAAGLHGILWFMSAFWQPRAEQGGGGVGGDVQGTFLAACRLPLGYFFIFFSFFFFCYWKWRHRNCCTFCGIAIGAAAGQRDKWVLHISQALKRVEPWVMSWCKDEGGGRRVASGATMTFSAAASICQGTANWSDGLWSLQQQMPSKSRQLTPYSPPWRHPALTTSKRN